MQHNSFLSIVEPVCSIREKRSSDSTSSSATGPGKDSKSAYLIEDLNLRSYSGHFKPAIRGLFE